MRPVLPTRKKPVPRAIDDGEEDEANEEFDILTRGR